VKADVVSYSGAGVKRVNVLGVGVSNLSLDEAAAQVEAFVRSGGKHYVCVSNVHVVMMCQEDPEYRRIHNAASMMTPDGKPLGWMQTLLGHPQPGRVYGPDLMLLVCKNSAQTGSSHFFYGGEDGVPQALAERFQREFPGIKIAGAYSPPFRQLTPEEDEAEVKMINDSGADIVWVGLGAPKQERWMAAHLGRLNAPVMLGVGAAFAFHTGRVSQAPGWMQRNGLEWLYRFAVEPRRLWRRYIWNNPAYLVLCGLQLLGVKKYEII
jgi:N-acetylglucosaminyldiphosphoundecaprenol N-acetyl-beta-D-mannosaminyltransferase